MNPIKMRRVAKLIALAISVLCLSSCGGSSSSGSGAGGGVSEPSNDRLEPGLQGQIPLAEQLNGNAAEGYRKGLRLVGENTILDRGANFSMAWLDDCAYITTTSPGQIFGPASSPYIDPQYSALNGMAVIDASDPENPELIDILQSPAMIAPHESIQANQARHIIVATRGGGKTFQ